MDENEDMLEIFLSDFINQTNSGIALVCVGYLTKVNSYLVYSARSIKIRQAEYLKATRLTKELHEVFYLKLFLAQLLHNVFLNILFKIESMSCCSIWLLSRQRSSSYK